MVHYYVNGGHTNVQDDSLNFIINSTEIFDGASNWSYISLVTAEVFFSGANDHWAKLLQI
jgi:hypothetical protein